VKQTAGVGPRRQLYPISPGLSSALLRAAALLAATALFFTLALLALTFLFLAILLLVALLPGTTRFARFVRILL